MLDELTRKLDNDDYAAIPADGKRWEILDAEPYVAPSPNSFHQRASKRLQRLLLSPSNRPYDRVTKMRRYAANRAPNYWIVDPDLQSIDCYRLTGDRYVDAGSFGPADSLHAVDFPGLALDLAAIWR